jgi:integrase
MTGVEKPGKETKRERVLTGDEIVAIWRVLGDHGAMGAAARVLLLTGARVSEITSLKWSEIDGATIKLAGARTKNAREHTIPLSTPARSIIENMPHVGEYVFARDDKRPVSRLDTIKGQIDAKSGVTDWVWHDFRRTISTVLNEQGVEPHIVEAIIGHAVKGVAGTYNYAKYNALKAAALEAWGAHVVGLVEGRAPGKVVPFQKEQRSKVR